MRLPKPMTFCVGTSVFGGPLFWFRLGRRGPGLHFKSASTQLLFSERYGYRPYIEVFGVRIAYLEPVPCTPSPVTSPSTSPARP